MYFFSLNRVALTSACFCATLLAAGAVKDPLFTKVFDGTLISAVDYGTEAGIFGNRMIVSFGGGNLTDPLTGTLVAKFLPGIGGELGLFGTNGIFYPDVRAVAQFVEDSALAYFDMRGVGDLLGAYTHTYLETSSAQYGHLSGKFLLLGVDVTTNPFTLAIYELDNTPEIGVPIPSITDSQSHMGEDR